MKVAIFSPFATVVPHFETELEIAQRHLDDGDTVEYVGCHGALSNCDFNTERDEKQCQDCLGRRNAGLTLLNPSLSSSPLSPIGASVERPQTFGTVQELITFKVENFDVGYAALSSLVSVIRDPEPDLVAHKGLLDRFIESALQTYFFTIDFLESRSPDLVYVFNGRFAAMRAILRACHARNIDCQLHERGCDNQHFELFKNHLPHEIGPADRRIRDLWEAADHRNRDRIGESWFLDRVNRVEKTWRSFVSEQQQGLLPSNWNPDRKNIAIFNSSDDEFVAIGGCWINRLFPNQGEAIRDFAAHMLCEQPDVHLYLRVHPNLAKVDNDRKNRLLALDFPNLTIIGPEEPADSYALLKAADTIVSFGSSIGIEAVYWGRPSLSLGPCFYQNLQGTYRPDSLKQTLDLLCTDLKPLPRTGALMYGHWLQTRGEKYRYFEADGLFDGKFKGQQIFAGMNAHSKKSVTQKIKRESSRIMDQLTRLRP